jgi:hypothetical protein
MTQRKLDDEERNGILNAADAIAEMCDWDNLPEGRSYWDSIHTNLSDKAKHGTTDGKPWVEPELTDEDAKQRPFVKVKDNEEDEWGRFVVRLVYVKPKGSYLRFTTEDPADDHAVLEWKYCRRATPEEIEAANADRR